METWLQLLKIFSFSFFDFNEIWHASCQGRAKHGVTITTHLCPHPVWVEFQTHLLCKDTRTLYKRLDTSRLRDQCLEETI